ncbi:uncharacterized protein SCHCODRAFT_02640726 [Schizophyllum commune H4-8]|uniref:uncharacterized protein n=1 Tax=Schizophyllum commune (strain H4-8 / FGSC 9210) TaxID=578458 RepID=UPI00215EE6FC|nr:uncharacterized protein SCHCODRAFT_02640726 [Schizophyllum commune H4-8]KAI5887097.1 hypothetical protein SCHCODRAFT_02640726 [Schizophyllum commune H4-8]
MQLITSIRNIYTRSRGTISHFLCLSTKASSIDAEKSRTEASSFASNPETERDDASIRPITFRGRADARAATGKGTKGGRPICPDFEKGRCQNSRCSQLHMCSACRSAGHRRAECPSAVGEKRSKWCH